LHPIIPYDNGKDFTMSQTFVSYSRRDVETVDKFVHAMSQSGMDIWIDREDIKAGNSWRVQIVEAIDSCDAFVLMLSSNSAASVNVHKEVILAADSGRTIFLVMLEPVKIPPDIRYQLAGLQFVDVQALGFERAAGQLIEAVKEGSLPLASR
jgi:limonene-1,2-epoxide hydrolase